MPGIVKHAPKGLGPICFMLGLLLLTAFHVPADRRIISNPVTIASALPTTSLGKDGLLNVSEVVAQDSFSDAVISKSLENIRPELIGFWSAVDNVDKWDEKSHPFHDADISREYILELKAGGTYRHTTVVTSGRLDYRVLIVTIGIWLVESYQIWFYPSDRHYRKWKNEMIITDEHSAPESYCLLWRKQRNEITSRDCLYVRPSAEEREMKLFPE